MSVTASGYGRTALSGLRRIMVAARDCRHPADETPLHVLTRPNTGNHWGHAESSTVQHNRVRRVTAEYRHRTIQNPVPREGSEGSSPSFGTIFLVAPSHSGSFSASPRSGRACRLWRILPTFADIGAVLRHFVGLNEQESGAVRIGAQAWSALDQRRDAIGGRRSAD
jgi:hypothetical protein